jgi:hypothetical protein
MLAYPINYPVRQANDLKSTMLGDNEYTVPVNRSQKSIEAADKHLREHAAESDNWDNFELMLNPMDEPIASPLSCKTAESFIRNLARDRYLKYYLRKTSREILTSRPVDVPFLHIVEA